MGRGMEGEWVRWGRVGAWGGGRGDGGWGWERGEWVGKWAGATSPRPTSPNARPPSSTAMLAPAHPTISSRPTHEQFIVLLRTPHLPSHLFLLPQHPSSAHHRRRPHHAPTHTKPPHPTPIPNPPPTTHHPPPTPPALPTPGLPIIPPWNVTSLALRIECKFIFVPVWSRQGRNIASRYLAVAASRFGLPNHPHGACGYVGRGDTENPQRQPESFSSPRAARSVVRLTTRRRYGALPSIHTQ